MLTPLRMLLNVIPLLAGSCYAEDALRGLKWGTGLVLALSYHLKHHVKVLQLFN